jgi:hypothetical protein
MRVGREFVSVNSVLVILVHFEAGFLPHSTTLRAAIEWNDELLFPASKPPGLADEVFGWICKSMQ